MVSVESLLSIMNTGCISWGLLYYIPCSAIGMIIGMVIVRLNMEDENKWKN